MKDTMASGTKYSSANQSPPSSPSSPPPPAGAPSQPLLRGFRPLSFYLTLAGLALWGHLYLPLSFGRLADLLFLLAICLSLCRRDLPATPLPRPLWPLFIWVVVFLMGYLTATITSGTSLGDIFHLGTLFFKFTVLCHLRLLMSGAGWTGGAGGEAGMGTPGGVEPVLRAYVWGAVAMAAAGLVVFCGQIDQIAGVDTRYTYRVQLFSGDPNVFGPYLVPAFFLMLAELQDEEKSHLGRWYHRVTMLGLVILALGVAVSVSRGAYANMVVAGMVYLAGLVFFMGRVRITLQMIGAIMLTVTLALVVLGGMGRLDLVAERLRFMDYDNQRFSFQLQALHYIKGHFWGVGLGRSEFFSGNKAVHNYFLKLFLEYGWLGFALVILFITRTIAAAVVVAAKSEVSLLSRLRANALLAAMAGFLVNGLVVDTLGWRIAWIIPAFIWGLSDSVWKSVEGSHHVHTNITTTTNHQEIG